MGAATQKLWRQGDVLIQEAPRLPMLKHKEWHRALYRGEASGHAHALKDEGSAEMYRLPGPRREVWLKVLPCGAEIVHPEHAAIALPAGVYRTWQQREYVDAEHAPRAVRD